MKRFTVVIERNVKEKTDNRRQTLKRAKHGKIMRFQERENIHSGPSAGKHTAGAKCGKTCNGVQPRANAQPMASRGKHLTGGTAAGKPVANGKLGKAFIRCQSREKTPPVEHGKACHQCNARKNIHPVPSAGRLTKKWNKFTFEA